MTTVSALEQVHAYHALSRHYFDRFADGPQFLDWDDQPNPFRRFAGTPLLPLQHIPLTAEPDYAVALHQNIQPSLLTLQSLSQLFYDSLALSAWKQAGEAKWSLRINPSSGNLHPTEAYVLLPALDGFATQPAIYHYAVREHGLEQRAVLPDALWQQLIEPFPAGTILMGLSSIHWREAWKYGERAFRYCQHDVGHAIATVGIAAAGLGWSVQVLDSLSSEELTSLLGLADLQTGKEAEHPDCLLAISPQSIAADCRPPAETIQQCQKLHWQGEANILSPEHLRWRNIEKVTRLTHKPAVMTHLAAQTEITQELSDACGQGLRQIIHQRRSAVAMDGKSGITAETFAQILRKLLPNQKPFTSLPWQPQVNLVLLVHRVQDVEPGLYCLLRQPKHLDALKAELKAEFIWQQMLDLPLYQLEVGDGRALAKQLSCHQSIAADGCFAVAMLANFAEPLEQYGAWFYPRLFWETGLIGQMLYLEAEASGISGTGIGCFFDQPVHEFLGINSQHFQSLYHFTVGGRVDDSRLLTLPAYES